MAGINIPPVIFTLGKQLFPQASDKEIIDGYGQVATEAAAKGHDLSAMPVDAQVKLFSAVAKGTQGQADPNVQTLPTQTITGQSQKGPAPMAVNPVAQQDAIFAGNGGTAARLAPTDPAAVAAAAQDLYKKQGGDNQAQRFADSFAASTAQGLGGQSGARDANAQRYKQLDEGVTTGLNKAQIDAGKSGIDTANSTAATSTTNAVAQQDVALRKAKFITDNGLASLDLEQKEKAWEEVGSKLYNGHGPMAKISQDLAAKALGVDAKSLDGMSPEELRGVIEHSKPTTDLQNQAQTQFQNLYNGITSRIGTQATANATNLGTKLVSNATGGGMTVPAGMNLSIGAGPASIAPSPATTGLQAGAADQSNSLRKQVTNWDTSGAGNASTIALKTLSAAGLKDTGIPGAYLSRITPTQAAALKTALIGQVMSANPGMDQASAEKSADTLMKSGTPGAIAQQLASTKAQQMANKTVILPAQEAWLKEHGDLTGFVPPKHQKYWNPVTGATAIGTDGEKPPKGWQPITEGK